jgi:glycosyltransferase involved in cell wall biosynthesis
MNYEHGISVVIPTYNSSRYIDKAIESVISFANDMPFEIICVDDQSDDKDELQEVISKYKFSSVIVKKEKSNAAVSRNIGIENSRFRWVFLLDSDDMLISDAAQRRIAIHEEQQCGLIFGNYITVSNGNSIVSNYLWKNENIRDFILLNGGDFRTSTISIDKHHFKQTFFDPESFKHQDWIFGFKCFDNNERMVFDQLPSAIINVDGESRMSSKINLSASRYLVTHYVSEQKHKNGFSKKNWKNVIAANDSEARNFFFNLYQPNSEKEKLTFKAYKLASSGTLMPVCSVLLTMLRKIKWQLAKFRH